MEQENELNNEFIELQNKAKELIVDKYFDSIKLNDIQYSILKRTTNATDHKDISPFIWNAGLIEKTLEDISKKLKEAKQQK